MPSDHLTFDTVTVGLGEDAAAPENWTAPPPPVLARLPRVTDNERSGQRAALRRTDPSGADFASFQVTTSQPAAVAAPNKPPGSLTPAPAAAPPKHEPAHDGGWSLALLKLQAGGPPLTKLLLVVALAAAAGATFLLSRGGRSAPAPIAPPPPAGWTQAPLAEAAPFVPPPALTPDTPIAEPPTRPAAEIAAAPVGGVTGPANRPPRVAAAPRVAEPAATNNYTADLAPPSIYPTTDAATPALVEQSTAPVSGNGPAARLTGRVRASGSGAASPSTTSPHEQNRSGLY